MDRKDQGRARRAATRGAACAGPEVPPTKADRDRLRDLARRYVAAARPVPPLSYNELYTHTGRLLERADDDGRFRKWLAVVLNNEAWRDRFAAVPADRRLLLLPKCLRDEADCPGVIDELGLVCKSCGRCPIHAFKTEAERLGYAVLVSEGTAVVSALIQSGRIQGLIGVCCMDSLEQVFPLMDAAAIPAQAIPLLYDGCSETAVDEDWVREAIALSAAAAGAGRLDLDGLRTEVASWFAPEALEERLGPPRGDAEQIARDWLARSGKRWRPFLVAAAWRALHADADAPIPPSVRLTAIAVECFHKASLVHDDIEDGDAVRYGVETVHAAHGVPVALNVGDFLIGEGYRLISEADVGAEAKARMLAAAAEGHLELCRGQGSELAWAREPTPMTSGQVLDIFQKKTSPAFAVALRLGAILAGAEPQTLAALDRFSEALGVAYQIRDDLSDFDSGPGGGDVRAARPSILLALAHERADGRVRRALDDLWRGSSSRDADGPAVGLGEALSELRVRETAADLMGRYRSAAVAAIEPLDSPDLKGLLRRVVGRIFDSIGERTPIRDLEARDASGRPLGAEPAA